MLGQDIIHAATNSQVKTPKHIGLAFTIHHLTGCKEVMTSNITPGPFVQFAADNDDFNEETLDGKQNHTRHNASNLSASAIWTQTPTEDLGRRTTGTPLEEDL